VLLVPLDTLSTARARELLPESVPHRVATHSAGRAALLVTALTQRPDLLWAATEDRLHQPYRASAFPESMALVEDLRAQGVAAMISGAGPGVLVLTTAENVSSVLVPPDGWQRLVLDVDQDGARVRVG
jgi:homoserine kinase